MHLDHATARGVGHAVEIAIDGDHAVAGDAPLESQNGLERPSRERLEFVALLGEMLGDNALGRGMDARIGDLIEPLAELRVEIVEVSKAATEEEVLADVTERALDLSLGFGPVWLARLWQETVVAGKLEQGAIVDDVARLGVVAAEDSTYGRRYLFRHAAERLECASVAAQQRLQVLVHHEAAPQHAAVAEYRGRTAR